MNSKCPTSNSHSNVQIKSGYNACKAPHIYFRSCTVAIKSYFDTKYKNDNAMQHIQKLQLHYHYSCNFWTFKTSLCVFRPRLENSQIRFEKPSDFSFVPHVKCVRAFPYGLPECFLSSSSQVSQRIFFLLYSNSTFYAINNYFCSHEMKPTKYGLAYSTYSALAFLHFIKFISCIVACACILCIAKKQQQQQQPSRLLARWRHRWQKVCGSEKN